MRQWCICLPDKPWHYFLPSLHHGCRWSECVSTRTWHVSSANPEFCLGQYKFVLCAQLGCRASYSRCCHGCLYHVRGSCHICRCSDYFFIYYAPHCGAGFKRDLYQSQISYWSIQYWSLICCGFY